MQRYGFYISILKLRRAFGVIFVLMRNGIIEFFSRTPVGKRLARRAIGRNRTTPYTHTTAERIRIIIEQLGPTYIKFGQILAERPDIISERFIQQLKLLQSQAQPFDDTDARVIISDELRAPIEQIFSSFTDKCVASASIGQVYHATLREDGNKVIIKVQRPNVEPKIRTDLYMMRYLARNLSSRYPEMRAINLTALVEDFAQGIMMELDYRNEAKHTQRFREIFHSDATVYIPRIYHAYTTRRILVYERIEGITPDCAQSLIDARLDPRTVATNGANAMIKMMFKHGFFHADPHPGNLFVLENNVVAFVDFGMVGTLRPRDIEFLASFALGFATQDSRLLANSLMKLCDIKYFDRMDELEFDLNRLMLNTNEMTIAQLDIARNIQEAVGIIIKYDFHIPQGIFMLIKSLSTIQRVGERLDPELSLAPLIIPHAQEVLNNKFSIKKISSLVRDTAKDYVRIVRELPGDISEIMYKLKEGKIHHEIHLDGQAVLMKTLRMMSLRVAYVLLLIGAFIGSALLISVTDEKAFGKFILYFSSALMIT
ncbi:MAG: AarF/ABC1/UbiB kinase family protein, partial [Alistipes sp.]|nr:AarF/ABC1/UbiB kinase family protein [Alistipes sp.]